MNGIKSRIYTDTNTLRYFGIAFRDIELDEDLRDHLIMSPMSILELLAQLAAGDAVEAFAAIQAIRRVHNPKYVAILPWSDDGLRTLFGLEPNPGPFMESIGNAVNNCLVAATAEELHEDSLPLQAILLKTKAETAANFAALLKWRREEGKLAEADNRAMFASSIAWRAGAPVEGINVDEIICQLEALYIFETEKLEIAARSENYNVEKHANDIYDAEQLVHLLDPVLHFLTSDGGFKRAAASSQSSRIHIAPAPSLMNPKLATAVIRQILTEAG
jgi:hypothetical protein